MSTILSKLDRKTFDNLPEILESYENRMNGWKKNVQIDGKNIEGANVEQSSWLAYYDELKVELRTLVDFLDLKIDEIRGKLTSEILNNSSLDTNHQTRERLIDAEPTYVKLYQNKLLAKEVYNTADMIVNNFIQRGYILKNLVQIRTAALQDITLFIDDR